VEFAKKGTKIQMRKFSIAHLLGLLLAGCVVAQANSPERAGIAEKQVLAIERAQVEATLKGGSIAADWFNRVFVDDIAYTAPDGGVLSRAQLQAEYRSGEQKMRSAHHSDYRVIAYADSMVVTYRADDVLERKGKILSDAALSTDVFVKQNGTWRMVAHQVTPVSW
jgi:Domain of unknown function (DUF4440)